MSTIVKKKENAFFFFKLEQLGCKTFNMSYISRKDGDGLPVGHAHQIPDAHKQRKSMVAKG